MMISCNIFVGISTDPTNYPGNSMNGHMDEIRISNSARYTTTFTPSATAFTNDVNTLLLIHANGTNGSNTFTDDISLTGPKTEALNTALSTSNDYWRGYDMSYLGNDSSGRPVFCTGFTKVTTQYPTLIMFRLNLDDLSITKGSEYTVESQTGVYVSVSSERDGAGLRTTSGFTDYGYVTWARYPTGTGSRASAFSYSLDNLTLSLGSSISIAGTSGNQNQSAGHYIGNLRVAATTNGGNNGNFYVQNWATRTANTTTLTKNTGADNSTLGFIGQGGGHNMRGMASDRWINVPTSGNNGHGWFVNAMRTNGTAMVGRDYDYNASTTDDVFNTEAKLAQLNNSTRFITACQGGFSNNTVDRIKAFAGTVNWGGTGSTAPTITVGSVVELETNTNSRFGLCEGKVDGEAYFIFCDNNDGLKLKYKKLTVTTNTIGQSAYTTLSVIGNTQGYYTIDATRMVQIGSEYYMLLGMRNSSNGNVEVAVVRNPV